jgi:error-prone DNA polymerase
MFDDYATSGVSLRAHPIQFIRNFLASRGATTAEALASKYGVRKGTRISVAGIAIIRQRPGTAKGVVFVTLEDETGSLNLIIRPSLFERYSKIIMMSTSLLATGALERIGEVVYVDVSMLESLDQLIKRLLVESSGSNEH